MMIELDRESYLNVEYFFKNNIQYIPALAVIHGNFPGRVFVDDIQQPSFAIVWAISRWIYIEGILERSGEIQNVLDQLWSEVRKAEPNRSWFEIYAKEDKAWENEFYANKSHLQVSRHYESAYELNVAKFHALAQVKITDPTLHCEVAEIPILPDEYLSDPYIDQHFKRKSRFGLRLIRGEETIAICKNNGFELENSYFIDVDTFDHQERGKGYATLVSQQLIQYGLEKGYTPLWETTHDNVPSHQLALKLGFERVSTYPVYRFVAQS